MLRDSVFEQDHVNTVVKVLLVCARWFLSFQFAVTKCANTLPPPPFVCNTRMSAGGLNVRLSAPARIRNIFLVKQSLKADWIIQCGFV
jgi:hypothetical protein